MEIMNGDVGIGDNALQNSNLRPREPRRSSEAIQSLGQFPEMFRLLLKRTYVQTVLLGVLIVLVVILNLLIMLLLKPDYHMTGVFRVALIGPQVIVSSLVFLAWLVTSESSSRQLLELGNYFEDIVILALKVAITLGILAVISCNTVVAGRFFGLLMMSCTMGLFTAFCSSVMFCLMLKWNEEQILREVARAEEIIRRHQII